MSTHTPPSEGGAPPPANPKRRSGGEFAGKLLLELFVVFISVYAAFALSDWDRHRQEDAKRRKLRQALAAEVRGTREIALVGVGNIRALREDFEGRRQRGEHPRPVAILSITRADPNVWNATVAAGGIDLIDVDTFVQVARFYNAVQAGLEDFEQIKRLSEARLLPVGGQPATAFYAPGTNELKPEYQWYPAMLGQLLDVGGIVVARGDSALASLQGEPRP